MMSVGWKYSLISKDIEKEPTFMKPIQMIEKIQKDCKTKNLIRSVRLKSAPTNKSLRKQIPVSEYRENVFKVAKTLLSYTPMFSTFVECSNSKSPVPSSSASHNNVQAMQHVLALLMIVRKLVSLEFNPPLNDVVNCDLVPFLFKILHFGIVQEYRRLYDPSCSFSSVLVTLWRELIFEASWILTNVASGAPAHTQTVVGNTDPSITSMSSIQTLLMLLHIDSQEIKQQTLWSLANITGDNASYRDSVIYAIIPNSLEGAKYLYRSLNTENIEFSQSKFPTMSSIDLINSIYLENKKSLSMNRIIAWTFSNCFRGKPVNVDITNAATVATVLQEMVQTSNDLDVLSDALWGIAYGTDTPDMNFINLFLNDSLLPILVRNISTQTHHSILLPSLRVFGNFIRLDDSTITQRIIDTEGFMDGLKICALAINFSVKKESLYILSNIAAGTSQQVQTLIDNNVLRDVIAVVFNTSDALYVGREIYSLKKEASWVLSNMTAYPEHVAPIFETDQLLEFLLKLYCDPMTENLLKQDALKPIFATINYLESTQRESVRQRVLEFAKAVPTGTLDEVLSLCCEEELKKQKNRTFEENNRMVQMNGSKSENE
ncbi:hypothetical protein FDP41_012671 [Naegleria fowleri]|uniref:Importin subunit alpha n=1 Tax=Naegleria fowleri TaxID=5763 RepID=A0A6A5BS34_NAEFO|nr:uncharacterized protein FDP41_012671 [Naegleria fowleri]KAF0980883.1 hypothetical protein FDP41_012671 [Naegleria fowleri]CAG4717208.1 unnamed protein product [Naegleria fowleri]